MKCNCWWLDSKVRRLYLTAWTQRETWWRDFSILIAAACLLVCQLRKNCWAKKFSALFFLLSQQQRSYRKLRKIIKWNWARRGILILCGSSWERRLHVWCERVFRVINWVICSEGSWYSARELRCRAVSRTRPMNNIRVNIYKTEYMCVLINGTEQQIAIGWRWKSSMNRVDGWLHRDRLSKYWFSSLSLSGSLADQHIFRGLYVCLAGNTTWDDDDDLTHLVSRCFSHLHLGTFTFFFLARRVTRAESARKPRFSHSVLLDHSKIFIHILIFQLSDRHSSLVNVRRHHLHPQ